MTHDEARVWAIRKIDKAEKNTPNRREKRMRQLNNMDDWDLSNSFFNIFGWDWQAHIGVEG